MANHPMSATDESELSRLRAQLGAKEIEALGYLRAVRTLQDQLAAVREATDPALIGIAQLMEESGGHWRPCSGCHDTEDGHPTQKYDFSQALQTAIGSGCTECGGLGATWEHYTAEEVAQMVRGEVEGEIEILQRLADGDTVVYSQDGDYGWFTKGDRAFVGDAIMELRRKGFLWRQIDDEDNYRGASEYDTISDAGRAALSGSQKP